MLIKSYSIGETARLTRRISEQDVYAFADLTGDHNPVHMDSEFAKQTRFKGQIAHGMLVAGLISAVLGNQLPGYGSVYLNQTLKFVAPVYFGDEITAEVCVKSWNAEKSIVTLDTRCFNQSGKNVLVGEAVLLADELHESGASK